MESLNQYGIYQPEVPRKKDRAGRWLTGTLLLFMFLGFMAGLVILALRNAYLFS